MKNRLVLLLFASTAAVGPLFLWYSKAHAQSSPLRPSAAVGTPAAIPAVTNLPPAAVPDTSDAEIPPPEPAPMAVSWGVERPNVLWHGEEHFPAFSRMAFGGDISPLGISLKSAVLLTEVFDGRLMLNTFNFDSGRFEIDGFNADVRLKLGSAAAALDWYPLHSIWRLSAGSLFFNRNQITATTRIVPGTSFTLNGTTFYSASANPSSTATPLTGTATLSLHAVQPALMLTAGFGRSIPRSRRHHWSFPSEFGVAFTGSPKLNIATAGTVCLDAARTQCASLSDSTNPAVAQFNQSLQGSLAKWRRSLSSFDVYPILSYGVMYSFMRPH